MGESVSAESCSLHIACGCLIQVHELRCGHHAAGSSHTPYIDSVKGRAWYTGTGARSFFLRQGRGFSSRSARSCYLSRTESAIVNHSLGTCDYTAAELCWTKCCTHASCRPYRMVPARCRRQAMMHAFQHCSSRAHTNAVARPCISKGYAEACNLQACLMMSCGGVCGVAQ